MRIVSDSTLLDALADWAMHEVSGRHGAEAPCDASDAKECLNFLLWYRSPSIARILGRAPLKTFVVDLEYRDHRSMILADGRTLAQWIEDVKRTGGEKRRYFDQLVDVSPLQTGRLFCAAKVKQSNPLRIGRLTLYDGWHRAAAWLQRCNSGRVSAIRSYVVVTSKEDRHLHDT